MKNNLLDIIFPKFCIYCKKQGEGYICSSCFSMLKNKSMITKVKNKSYDYFIYLDKYKGKTRKQMLDFKFYNKAFYSEYFIDLLLYNEKICKFLKEYDYIVPVPMNNNRKLQRGYNQTELLADFLGKRLNIEVGDFLVKPKEYQVQSSLSKEERIKNVKNAFKIRDKSNVYNKNIILLDDIFTTGATVEVCSRELNKAGANKICALVIAKA